MQSGTLRIRRGLVRDAQSVHATLWTARDEIPLRPTFDSPDHVGWVRTQCRDRQVWIAEVGDHLAGVMVMNVHEIFYLVTLPAFRRHGVGRMLIRHAIAVVARRYSSGVKAKARLENAPIVALLMAEGFKPHPVLIAQSRWSVYFVGDVR